jgi:uncharacterized MAPEG superfamily protein
MMAILLILVSIRVHAILIGKKRANDFNTDGTDVSEFSGRLCRVHANSYEHFAIFAGLMLYALALDLAHITNHLALYLLAARVLQGVVHLFSTSINANRLRFAFFLAQYVIAAIWIFNFIKLYNH